MRLRSMTDIQSLLSALRNALFGRPAVLPDWSSRNCTLLNKITCSVCRQTKHIEDNESHRYNGSTYLSSTLTLNKLLLNDIKPDAISITFPTIKYFAPSFTERRTSMKIYGNWMKQALVIASLTASLLLTTCSGHPHLTPRQEARRDQSKLHNCNAISDRTARGQCLMGEARRHYLYAHSPGQRSPHRIR